MQITGNYISPLSTKIQHEYNKLTSYIDQIPISKHTEKLINGNLSITNLISYQIGWGNLLLGWYEAGLKGEMPQMPGEGFIKWDYKGLNNHFYNKYQDNQKEHFFKL